MEGKLQQSLSSESTSPEWMAGRREKELLRLLLVAQGGVEVGRWLPKGAPRKESRRRNEEMRESLAEHVGGLSAIAAFLLLYAEKHGDPTLQRLDARRVFLHVNLHDAAELHTGDWPIGQKDENRKREEERAQRDIVERFQAVGLGEQVETLLTEWNQKSTPEARFVKAIDLLQALLTIIYQGGFDRFVPLEENPNGARVLQYAKEFPLVYRLILIAVRLCHHSLGAQNNTRENSSTL